jgi:hypothetical protein
MAVEKKEILSISMTIEQIEKLKDEAVKNGKNVSEFCREILFSESENDVNSVQYFAIVETKLEDFLSMFHDNFFNFYDEKYDEHASKFESILEKKFDQHTVNFANNFKKEILEPNEKWLEKNGNCFAELKSKFKKLTRFFYVSCAVIVILILLFAVNIFSPTTHKINYDEQKKSMEILLDNQKTLCQNQIILNSKCENILSKIQQQKTKAEPGTGKN